MVKIQREQNGLLRKVSPPHLAVRLSPTGNTCYQFLCTQHLTPDSGLGCYGILGWKQFSLKFQKTLLH